MRFDAISHDRPANLADERKQLVRDKIFEISDEIPGTLGTNNINP